jgi:dipeptidase D
MEAGPYRGLEPVALWGHFAALNAIPRPSGHEAAAREYARGVAEAAGAEWEVDGFGNAVARVGPSDGSGGPAVAVQAHLDMVCESAPGVEHDCERDPIQPEREGDLVLASGTTLGADNGIGVAAALALLSDPPPAHGPLELLFTVEEETGLHGAMALDASLLHAEALINFDSEDDGALTVGCAGGADVKLALPLEREPVPAGWRCVELRVSGLAGGHSGMQIHERRANAISLAARALGGLPEAGEELRLVSIEGGSAHNVIPREAVVRLALANEDGERVLSAALAALREEWGEAEPDLELTLEAVTSAEAISPARSALLVGLLRELPHGVIAMSERFPGTVETSTNLAIVRSESDGIRLLSSVRSLKPEALEAVRDRIVGLGEAAGASAEAEAGYPGWEPRERSPLLDATVAAYIELHGREPRIEVLHGGLECGVIVAKKPTLDAISFGPLIEGPHTPGERVHAATVADAYRLLVALLGRLAAAG